MWVDTYESSHWRLPLDCVRFPHNQRTTSSGTNWKFMRFPCCPAPCRSILVQESLLLHLHLEHRPTTDTGDVSPVYRLATGTPEFPRTGNGITSLSWHMCYECNIAYWLHIKYLIICISFSDWSSRQAPPEEYLELGRILLPSAPPLRGWYNLWILHQRILCDSDVFEHLRIYYSST